MYGSHDSTSDKFVTSAYNYRWSNEDDGRLQYAPRAIACAWKEDRNVLAVDQVVRGVDAHRFVLTRDVGVESRTALAMISKLHPYP